jgi:MSHA pilin protein MshD
MRRAQGMTLIEVVVATAVISIAGTVLVGTLGYVNHNSGAAMLQAQAQSIATAYLNEITAKSFNDPDGVDGELSRDLYDDVNDYDGLDDAQARDRFGNIVGNFRVRVAVSPAALNGVPALNSFRIDVTVDFGNGRQVMATGFRMNY